MIDRLLDLVFIRIAINVQNLSGIDQIGVFDFGPVSFEEQRPLVGVTVNFLLGRNTPEVVTDLNDIPVISAGWRRYPSGTGVGRCSRGLLLESSGAAVVSNPTLRCCQKQGLQLPRSPYPPPLP
ncbi:MAG: hypothetical protein Ct9H300mP16_08620 [Pseudomonadota bacterium]|nr:MAG: hypothetical protein Ct9H300mP16_08620 [Pseudomonadota bacterium]